MECNLDQIMFSTTSAAFFAGCTSKTIGNHCQNGQLNFTRIGKQGHYRINGKDFADYLYQHPTFSSNLEKLHVCGVKNIVKKMLLDEINARPKLYTVHNLEDIFFVTKRTVSGWVEKGLLNVHCYENRETKYVRCFSEKDIQNFVAKCPNFRKIYTAYNEKRNEFTL